MSNEQVAYDNKNTTQQQGKYQGSKPDTGIDLPNIPSQQRQTRVDDKKNVKDRKFFHVLRRWRPSEIKRGFLLPRELDSTGEDCG